jgi:hypothetical protein
MLPDQIGVLPTTILESLPASNFGATSPGRALASAPHPDADCERLMDVNVYSSRTG